VVNGSIVLQSVLNENGALVGGFSMSGSDLRFMYDPFASSTSRRLMAIRVG
jgi:YD repeat-containing protein